MASYSTYPVRGGFRGFLNLHPHQSVIRINLQQPLQQISGKKTSRSFAKTLSRGHSLVDNLTEAHQQQTLASSADSIPRYVWHGDRRPLGLIRTRSAVRSDEEYGLCVLDSQNNMSVPVFCASAPLPLAPQAQAPIHSAGAMVINKKTSLHFKGAPQRKHLAVPNPALLPNIGGHYHRRRENSRYGVSPRAPKPSPCSSPVTARSETTTAVTNWELPASPRLPGPPFRKGNRSHSLGLLTNIPAEDNEHVIKRKTNLSPSFTAKPGHFLRLRYTQLTERDSLSPDVSVPRKKHRRRASRHSVSGSYTPNITSDTEKHNGKKKQRRHKRYKRRSSQRSSTSLTTASTGMSKKRIRDESAGQKKSRKKRHHSRKRKESNTKLVNQTRSKSLVVPRHSISDKVKREEFVPVKGHDSPSGRSVPLKARSSSRLANKRANNYTAVQHDRSPGGGADRHSSLGLMADIEAVKIGVATKPRKRLKAHKSKGALSRSVDHRGPKTGSLLHRELSMRAVMELEPADPLSNSTSSLAGTVTASGVKDNDPETFLSDFKNKLKDVKGKGSIKTSHIEVMAYLEGRNSSGRLHFSPKTYQQIGLPNLTRSPSSENMLTDLKFMNVMDDTSSKASSTEDRPRKIQIAKSESRTGKSEAKLPKHRNLSPKKKTWDKTVKPSSDSTLSTKNLKIRVRRTKSKASGERVELSKDSTKTTERSSSKSSKDKADTSSSKASKKRVSPESKIESAAYPKSMEAMMEGNLPTVSGKMFQGNLSEASSAEVSGNLLKSSIGKFQEAPKFEIPREEVRKTVTDTHKEYMKEAFPKTSVEGGEGTLSSALPKKVGTVWSDKPKETLSRISARTSRGKVEREKSLVRNAGL